MSSDEEYLDDLLKSIMEDDGESEEANADSSVEVSDAFADMADDLNEDDLINIMNAVNMDFEEGAVEESTESIDVESDMEAESAESEDFSLDGFAIEDFGVLEPEEGEMEEESESEYISEEVATDESADSEEGSDTDLALDDFAIEDFGVMEPDADFDQAGEEVGEVEIEAETETTEADELDFSDFAINDFGEEEMISADEVDAMFAAADEAVADKSVSSGGSTEEDMLAMLESMSAETEAENQSFGDEMLQSITGYKSRSEENAEEDNKSEKKKKGLFSKRGKKKGDKESGTEGAESQETDAEPKKQGFFAKVMTFLTESDEEEEEAGAENGMNPSDENKNILNELAEEDKKKKKKKVKGKKVKDEEAGGEESDDEEVVEDKKSKKEKKKKKKEKEVAIEGLEPEEEAKPTKKVSKKNVAVIAGLCLTMTAVIVVLCSIVPGFFDKRAARDAFYQSDYEKSYELLYGKKLDNSDTIIYNKCKIIMEMNRKLDAYHNYIGIGKNVEALDALMAGVEKYPSILLEAEEYHVTQEVDAIYETMLNILNDKYSLTEDMAKAIIAYDDLTYTRKLDSIVNGTPFVNPNAELRTPDADLLPEEQAMMETTSEPAENDGVREEEELPLGEGSDTVATEDAVNEVSEETVQDVVAGEEADELPGSEDADGQEADSVQTNTDSYDNVNSSTGSQGELIQGIKQPISLEIHGQ